VSERNWYRQPAAAANEAVRERALARQGQLTKPPGSLGRLEQGAVQLATLQGRDAPSLDQVLITVFAADHGVAAEGVSAYPQVVTGEMVRNFAAGGAAITVLARELGARFQVVNVGTAGELPSLPNVLDRRLAPGTANLRREPAMFVELCEKALAVGREALDAVGALDLFIGGEMGIANTTAATALACALLPAPPVTLVGRGTGLDASGVEHKTRVIEEALKRHAALLHEPLEALAAVGGLELAALAGAYIRAAQRGVPVLVDGFICTAAALAALRLNPSVRPWLLFSHCSAERGHRALIDALTVKPLLDLDLRLGEGSGAALALPLLRLACALHNGMASFDDAGVSRA
jgi:nicotinate-nucleotide--dimethylbenzimidazole phosphoribosyltransferase